MAISPSTPLFVGAEHVPQPGAVQSRGRIVAITFSDLGATATTTNTTNPPTTVLHSHAFTTINHRSTLVLHANIGAQGSANANVLRFGLILDGVRLVGRGYRCDVAACHGQVSLDAVVFDVAAGDHTLDVVWSISANTATCTVDANRLSGVHVRAVEYALPAGSNDMGHLADTLDVGGGKLIRVTRVLPQVSILSTASAAVPPTERYLRAKFVSEQRSTVIVDAYCMAISPSGAGGAAGTYNYRLSIDGVAVIGRRSTTRTTNQTRQTQITYTTRDLAAGAHEAVIAWSGTGDLTSMTSSSSGAPQRHSNPNGYYGYGPALHVREIAA